MLFIGQYVYIYCTIFVLKIINTKRLYAFNRYE